MKRIIYSVSVGLILAVIVHLSVILLMPRFAEKDAWGKLSSIGPAWLFTKIGRDTLSGGSLIPSVDPLFEVAACRFSLGDSALRISAFGELPFWSASVFDRYGNNMYSFNDRNAVDRRLDLIIVNPVQMAQLRKAPPEFIEQSVVVEANIQRGFVLIRALAPDTSWQPILDAFLSEAKCEQYETRIADLPTNSIEK